METLLIGSMFAATLSFSLSIAALFFAIVKYNKQTIKKDLVFFIVMLFVSILLFYACQTMLNLNFFQDIP